MRRLLKWLWLPSGAALLVLLAALWLLFTAGGSRWLVNHIELPEALSIGQLDGSLWRGLELSELELSWDSGRLRVDQLRVRLRPLGLFEGIRIEQLEGSGVLLRLAAADPDLAVEPFNPAALENYAAPLPVLLEQGVLNGVLVERAGAEPLLLERLSLAGRWADAVDSLALALIGDGFALNLEGRLALAAGDTALDAVLQAEGRRLHPDLAGALTLEAKTRQGLDALTFELSYPSLTVKASGQVDELFGQRLLALTASWERLALAGLPAVPEALAEAALLDGVGELHLEGDTGSFSLAGGMSGATNEPLRWQISGSGTSQALDLERIEIASAGNELIAQGRLAGTVDDWSFTGDLALSTARYPDGKAQLAISGDDRALTIRALDARVLGGQITGSGGAVWGPADATPIDPSLDLALQLADVDLAELLPDWPASISGDLSVSLAAQRVGEVVGEAVDEAVAAGATDGANWTATVRTEGLAGTLFDEPLFLAGELKLAPQAVSLETLRLRAGQASVAVTGRVAGTAQLQGEIDVPAAGWLAERLGGAWHGSLAVDTGQRFPVREAALTGVNIKLGLLQAREVRLERAPASGQALLSLNGAQFDAYPLDRLKVALEEQGGQLSLGLSAATERLSLEALSTGRLDGAGTAQLPSWQGVLAGADLSLDGQPLLSLQGPAPLAAGMSSQRLEDACFRHTAGGRVCLDWRGAQDSGQTLALALESLSLEPIGRWLELGLKGSQTIDGTVQWQRTRSGPPSGTVALRVSPGAYTDPARPEFSLETGPGVVAFELQAGQLREGRLNLSLPDSGYLRSRFEVDGLQLDGSGQLSGSVEAALNGMSLVDELIPVIGDLEGRLRLNLALSGRTGDPVFDGGFDLSDVRFSIPTLGTGVDGLSLRGRVNQSDLLVLRGEYRVGAGQGALSVRADFSAWDQPRFTATVDGQDLELVRLADLSLDLSPALQLSAGPDGWRVDGRAEVPRASVTPVAAFVNRVDESEDVVIVNGGESSPTDAAPSRPAAIYGEVAVTLGDEVKLRMDVADLALAGGATLTWAGDLLPTAAGEVLANGTVSVWGPKLVMNNGRVRWSGAAVTNPSLELRAERDVFGGTIVRSAGVRVSGTARRPDVEAYTRPLTTSERAWAVLLTGSDINFAQGVGAFDVGAYIAPRVFLSYGISFFDSENVVGLRYDLRRGWGIKATSGQSESGVDLSYTIEK